MKKKLSTLLILAITVLSGCATNPKKYCAKNWKDYGDKQTCMTIKTQEKAREDAEWMAAAGQWQKAADRYTDQLNRSSSSSSKDSCKTVCEQDYYGKTKCNTKCY